MLLWDSWFRVELIELIEPLTPVRYGLHVHETFHIGSGAQRTLIPVVLLLLESLLVDTRRVRHSFPQLTVDC